MAISAPQFRLVMWNSSLENKNRRQIMKLIKSVRTVFLATKSLVPPLLLYLFGCPGRLAWAQKVTTIYSFSGSDVKTENQKPRMRTGKL